MISFDLKTIPSLKGRIAVVTGANAGIGYETALALAKKDVEVILACRNLDKAEAAKRAILGSCPSANISAMHIDLSGLASVRDFARQFTDRNDRLDLLINNAGIMVPPYQLTADGFESQIATNYLGHFLLTGLLLNTLEKTKGSRVVTLSSIAHKRVDINFDDLHFKNGYNAVKAYGQSKLACLLFAYELQRRLEKNNYQVISLASHPGVATTELSKHMSKFMKFLMRAFAPFLFQDPKRGAEPTIRAALDQHVKGGEYFGPGGYREFKGPAVQVDSSERSKDKTLANKLWETSEELTQISYLD